MSDTLQKFESLADQARGGDAAAEQEFFSEAARLFPADFGEGGHFSRQGGTAPDFDRALALIRQATSSGG
jgi:hypothetical protein